MATQTTATAATMKMFNYSENVNIYLRDIRKHKVLSKEDEEQLFRIYKEAKENDDKATIDKVREEIILKNQLFIFSIAKEYAEVEEEVLDYVSEGNIGLMVAIDEFDVDHEFINEEGEKTTGLRFLTFAKNYIRRQMRDYFDNVKPLVKQTNSNKYKFKVQKIKRKFLSQEGRMPAVEEVAEILEREFGEEVKDLSYLYDMDFKSTDATYDREEEAAFMESDEFCERTNNYNDYDTKCDSKREEDDEFRMVKKALTKLNKENRDIIRKYFGIGRDVAMSVDAIAEEYGMYPEDMQEILNRTLGFIKQEVKTYKEMAEAV